MITFLKTGGTGSTAAEYFESEKDHMGQDRAGVQVLRGDPELVARVADSLEFKNKYTSGVLAWTKEDNPSPEEIDKTLDSFEALAWAGLEKDRYAWSAIRHDEPDGKVHVHIFAARVDLDTGKSLNIAPPGWQETFFPWVSVMNTEHDWDRPDDPERRKDAGLSHAEEKINASRRKSGLAPLDNPKEELTELLHLEIMEGNEDVQDRKGVIAYLQDFGEITRTGKNYISIKPPNADKAIRLRGPIYDEQFNAELYRSDKAETTSQRTGDRGEPGERVGTTRTDLHERIENDREKYLSALEKRRNYHREKYKPSSPSAERNAEDRTVLRQSVLSPGGGPDHHDVLLRRHDASNQDLRSEEIPRSREEYTGPGHRGEAKRDRFANTSIEENEQRATRLVPRRKPAVDRRDREEMSHDRTRNEVARISEINTLRSRELNSATERYRRRNKELKRNHRNLSTRAEYFGQLAGRVRNTIAKCLERVAPVVSFIRGVIKNVSERLEAPRRTDTPTIPRKTAYSTEVERQ